MKRLLRHFLWAAVMSLPLAHACTTGEFSWPISGTVSSPAGYRTHPTTGETAFHEGIDIAVPMGTPIYAAGSGTITTRRDTGNAGNSIIIRHPTGIQTVYGHLSGYAVALNQEVTQGQLIGYAGSTGRSTGPHLHFEINANNRQVPMVGNQSWSSAAGASVGSSISHGSCIANIAGANLTPGGAAGDVEPGAGTGNPGSGQQIDTDGDGVADGVDYDGDGEIDVEYNGDGNADYGIPYGAFSLDGVDFEGLLPQPTTWMTAAINLLVEYNMYGHANKLGIVLLFAFFVYSIASANLFFRTDEYFFIFARLAVAAGLVMGTGPVANGLNTMWSETYKWMEKTVVKPAVDDLEVHINGNMNDLTIPVTERTTGLAQTFAVLAAISTFSEVTAVAMPDTVDLTADAFVAEAGVAIDAGEEFLNLMKQKSGQVAKMLLALMFLMGSLYGIYFLAIYGAGLIVVLAGFLLPILAPFLLLPGSSSWIMKWFNMVVLSLVVVTVMPFVFRIVVEQGVNAPIKETNSIGAEMARQLEQFGEEVKASVPNSWNPLTWKESVVQFYDAVRGMVNAFFAVMVRWMFQAVILAISVLASIYVMQQIPRIITGFIGGAFGGAAGATTGGAIGGMIGGMIGSPGTQVKLPPQPNPNQKALPPGGGTSYNASKGATSEGTPRGAAPRDASRGAVDVKATPVKD
jgi:hypothetical protein